jgi:hypothetical protein
MPLLCQDIRPDATRDTVARWILYS